MIERIKSKIDKLINSKAHEAESKRLLHILTSSLETKRSLLEASGLRITQYDSNPDNPDNLLARNGRYVDSVMSKYGESFSSTLLSKLNEDYDSVTFVGIVQDEKNGEFVRVMEVNILDDQAFKDAQLTLHNNKQRFTTRMVFVREKVK